MDRSGAGSRQRCRRRRCPSKRRVVNRSPQALARNPRVRTVYDASRTPVVRERRRQANYMSVLRKGARAQQVRARARSISQRTTRAQVQVRHWYDPVVRSGGGGGGAHWRAELRGASLPVAPLSLPRRREPSGLGSAAAHRKCPAARVREEESCAKASAESVADRRTDARTLPLAVGLVAAAAAVEASSRRWQRRRRLSVAASAQANGTHNCCMLRSRASERTSGRTVEQVSERINKRLQAQSSGCGTSVLRASV